MNIFGLNYKWYLDGRNRKPEQKAISICLTEGNERKYFPIGVYVSDEQWSIIQKERGGLYTRKSDIVRLFGDGSELDNIVDEMNEYDKRVDKVYRELRDLNGYVDLKTFWERFMQPMVNNGKLIVRELLEEMQAVKTNRKTNTKIMDWTAYDSLYKYYNLTTGKSEQQFRLTDIDTDFLKAYEKYKCHSTGVYTNFRHIRTLFNYAIEQGYIPTAKYPFGKNKVPVNQAMTRNIALSNESFQKLYYADQCDFLTDRQKECIMYLIASWCCNGCNPMDLLQLRHRDIVRNKITFTRTKTKGRIQAPKAIVIDVNEKLHQIIEHYGTPPNATGSNYIFPILSEGDSEEQISCKVALFRHKNPGIVQ